MAEEDAEARRGKEKDSKRRKLRQSQNAVSLLMVCEKFTKKKKVFLLSYRYLASGLTFD